MFYWQEDSVVQNMLCRIVQRTVVVGTKQVNILQTAIYIEKVSF